MSNVDIIFSSISSGKERNLSGASHAVAMIAVCALSVKLII